MPQVSSRSFRVWQRNRDVFLRLWKTDAIPVLIEPVVILGVMGLGLGRVVQDLEGQSYLEFIGPGVLAAYVMFAAVFENSWNSYVRMEVRRTFDAIIATPLSIEDVITGEILWGTTRALITGTVILVVLTVIGVVQSPTAILILPMAALQGFLFGSLAMTYTSKVPSVNAFNYLFSVFIYPMFMLSGVFFPLEELPRALQIVAWFLPLTPAVRVSQGLISGDMELIMLWSVLLMVAEALFFYSLALRFMRKRLIT